jgi:parallel beta-helix repeat protein
VIETGIFENNYRSFHTGWHGGGSKNVKTVRASFVNCVAARNNGSGIWFDIDCQDTRVVGNRIHDNQGAGIHYEISFGLSVIANNLIYRNEQAAVYLSCSSGTLVAHNTMVENGRAIAVAGSGRLFEVPAAPMIDVTDKGRVWREWGGKDGQYPMSRNRIVNNLFVRNGVMGDRELQSRELLIEKETPLATNNVSDANVFVGGWWPVRLGQNWNEQQDLESWRAKTGNDKNSVVLRELAYMIDGDGGFSWDDPAAVGRAIRVCPPAPEAGADMGGRARRGKRVQAGAQILP